MKILQKVKGKIKDFKRKIKLYIILSSIFINVSIMISHRFRDEKPFLNFLKEFNKKHKLSFITPTSFEKLEESYKKGLSKEPKENLNKRNVKITEEKLIIFSERKGFLDIKKGEKYDVRVLGTSIKNLTLNDFYPLFENIRTYSEGIYKEKPRNLNIEIYSEISIKLDKNFTQDKVKFLKDNGYGEFPLISYQEFKKLRKNDK